MYVARLCAVDPRLTQRARAPGFCAYSFDNNHRHPTLENKTFSVFLATKDLTIRMEREIKRLVLVQ